MPEGLSDDLCLHLDIKRGVYSGAKSAEIGILGLGEKIHWSDESRFLLHMTDGRVRVWRQRGTAYDPRNIQEKFRLVDAFLHDCKIDLITVQ